MCMLRMSALLWSCVTLSPLSGDSVPLFSSFRLQAGIITATVCAVLHTCRLLEWRLGESRASWPARGGEWEGEKEGGKKRSEKIQHIEMCPALYLLRISSLIIYVSLKGPSRCYLFHLWFCDLSYAHWLYLRLDRLLFSFEREISEAISESYHLINFTFHIDTVYFLKVNIND